MTFQAGIAVIVITIHLFVFVVHFGFIVFMTISTAEYGIIFRYSVAIAAVVPLSLVAS